MKNFIECKVENKKIHKTFFCEECFQTFTFVTLVGEYNGNKRIREERIQKGKVGNLLRCEECDRLG